MKIKGAMTILNKRCDFFGWTFDQLISKLDDGFDDNSTVLEAYEVYKMKAFLDICEHFSKLQEQLGYESIWSISEVGFADLNKRIFTDKPRRVAYRYVDSFGETEVSMLATNGSIQQLWFAAESCIRQSGTHHRYIENFHMQEDGSLLLTTGS